MSANCGVCDAVNDSSNQIKCAGICGKVFHMSCVIDKFPDSVKTRGARREWFCDDCKKVTTSSNSSKSSEPPAALTKEYLKNVLDAFKHDVFAELRSYTTQFDEFKTSLEFVSSKIDETNKNMEEIKNQNKSIIKENECLKRTTTLLTQRVSALEEKLRDLEQYSRRDNIEVNGLPKSPNENEMDILRDLGRAIGVEVEESSVVAVHRVPAFNRERTPSLIARFTTRAHRDEWLYKYRERKTLMASDVNRSFPKARVYIGEHLTPANKLLLKGLKEAGKKLNVRYVWCREGKFFARKSEGQKCVRVSGVDELKKMFP